MTQTLIRRALLLAILLIVGFMAVVMTPHSAHAAPYGQPSASFTPQWATVGGSTVWCETSCSRPAWTWNGSWTGADRPNGARVWIYPWSSAWVWTWTQSTGWEAMRTTDVYLDPGVR